jgi:hypothetical protein
VTDIAKPIGQSNLNALFERERVREALAKTPEMVRARRPSGGHGELLSDFCQWCFNPFSYIVGRNGQQRSSVQYEDLCLLLHMPTNTQPVICDPCYEYVVGTARNATRGFEQPGWNNGMDGCRPNPLLSRVTDG